MGELLTCHGKSPNIEQLNFLLVVDTRNFLANEYARPVRNKFCNNFFRHYSFDLPPLVLQMAFGQFQSQGARLH